MRFAERAAGLFFEHRLLACLSATLVAFALYAGATPLLALSLVLFAILPGYLLLLLIIEQTDLERVLMAVPASIAFVSAVTLVPNILLDVKSVDANLVIIETLVLLALLFVRGAKHTARESTTTVAIVVVLLLAASIFSIHLLGSTLGNDLPLAVHSLDSADQITQIQWNAKSHDSTLSTTYTFGEKVFNTALTPPSILTQVLMVQFSGAEAWNANDAFLLLIYVTMVLGVFLLFRRCAGEMAGIACAVSLIVPLNLLYVSPFYFGLWRLVFSMFIIPFLIYFSLAFFDGRGKDAPAALAILLFVLLLTHPTDIVAAAASLAFVAAFAISSGRYREFFAPAAVAAPVFILIAFPLFVQYWAGLFAPAAASSGFFSLGFDADKVYGSVLGPTLIKLAAHWPVLLAGFLVSLALFVAAVRRGRGEALAADWRVHLFANLAICFGAAFGALPVLGQYIPKLRYVLYSDFILPLIGLGAFFIAKEALRQAGVRNSAAAMACACVALVILAAPWAYGFYTPDEGWLKGSAGEILLALRDHVPDNAKVLFLTYYWQHMGCISGHSCFQGSQAGLAEMAAANKFSRRFPIDPPCWPAMKKVGFLNYELVPNCSPGFDYGNICNYDIIVVGHLPSYSNYTLALVDKLNGHYAYLYQKGGFSVQKRVSSDANCLPE
jgi:hypothetical protein